VYKLNVDHIFDKHQYISHRLCSSTASGLGEISPTSVRHILMFHSYLVYIYIILNFAYYGSHVAHRFGSIVSALCIATPTLEFKFKFNRLVCMSVPLVSYSRPAARTHSWLYWAIFECDVCIHYRSKFTPLLIWVVGVLICWALTLTNSPQHSRMGIFFALLYTVSPHIFRRNAVKFNQSQIQRELWEHCKVQHTPLYRTNLYQWS